MVLDQGILRPRVIGRQVETTRYTQKKEGLSVDRMERLIQTGKPNICVIRSLGGIGDVLMTTPLLRALKHKWPKSQITYATDFKYMDGALRDILLYNPNIDELLQYQVASSREYDLKVDITSVCIATEKSGIPNVPNRIDLFARHVGVSLNQSGFLPTYIVSDEEKEWAKRKLERYPRRTFNSPRIGIQARSSTISRSWPLDRVRELAARLVSEVNAQVVVFDSSHGHGPQETWNLSGVIGIKDYKIRQVAALINEMDLMVTPDSGLMHIAGALNKKIVSIWAGSDPASRINHYPNAIAIARTNYKCFPCWYSPVACNKSYLCIKSVTVDEVYDATRELLGQEILTESVSTCETPSPSSFDYCIVRDDGIGDIVACLPAFSAFKKKHPNKRIVFATMAKNVELASLSGCFHGIYPLYEKWDEVEHANLFDARDLFESKKMSKGEYGDYFEDKSRLMAMSEFLGVEPDLEYRLPRDPAHTAQCYEIFDERGVDPERDWIVTLQFGATCKARTWDQNHIKNLLRKLSDVGYTCVMLGQPREPLYDTYHCVNLTGELSISMFNATIAASDAFIGIDSGGVHLAARNGVPFVAIYNAIDPALRLEGYDNYRVIFPRSLDCAPCFDKGCKGMTCMEMMNSQVVYDAFRDLTSSFFEKNHKEISI